MCSSVQAATALTNMAHNSDANRIAIVRGGGVALLLDAMQAFGHNTRLQRQACCALLTLAALPEASDKKYSSDVVYYLHACVHTVPLMACLCGQCGDDLR